MFNKHVKTFQYGNQTVTLETGEIARQAAAAVKVSMGDTVVLVAVTTTPAWTPLFASASGIVTDIGGPLSHSSIVARECGIPAVMATHTATRSIKNGQMITVDGSEGTVTIDE